MRRNECMSDMSTTSDMISIKEPSSHSASNLRDPVQIPMLEVAVWNVELHVTVTGSKIPELT
jgi:hypothetical protein